MFTVLGTMRLFQNRHCFRKFGFLRYIFTYNIFHCFLNFEVKSKIEHCIRICDRLSELFRV